MGRKRKINTTGVSGLSDLQKKQLAALVEQNEAIWKINHKDYRRSDKKLVMWKNIAQEMNLTGTPFY